MTVKSKVGLVKDGFMPVVSKRLVKVQVNIPNFQASSRNGKKNLLSWSRSLTMEMSDGNQDVPHQQVKLIGGLTGGCGGSIDGVLRYFTKWGWKEYANFTYPGQIIDETNTESNETFIKRISHKYIAEKILVEKPRTKIAIYGDSFENNW